MLSDIVSYGSSDNGEDLEDECLFTYPACQDYTYEIGKMLYRIFFKCAFDQ